MISPLASIASLALLVSSTCALNSLRVIRGIPKRIIFRIRGEGSPIIGFGSIRLIVYRRKCLSLQE